MKSNERQNFTRKDGNLRRKKNVVFNRELDESSR